MFKRIAIFGVGLIGGSFALALKRAGKIQEVVGVGRRRETLERALALGIIDRIAADSAAALRQCDLALISAPVAQTGALLTAMASHLEPQTIVTDAGSTKMDVVAAARAALGGRITQFVPGHPIAGREQHGPEAALADLYVGKRVLLTPLQETERDMTERVRDAWVACGAQVSVMSPETHDAVLSSVSHLPHLLAYALVAQIAASPDAQTKFELAGAGFRDFTRIAASSPEMWRDIVLANRAALGRDLDDFEAMLRRMRAMIEVGDGTGIEALFASASRARRSLNRPD